LKTSYFPLKLTISALLINWNVKYINMAIYVRFRRYIAHVFVKFGPHVRADSQNFLFDVVDLQIDPSLVLKTAGK